MSIGEPRIISLERTDYAPGVPNEWHVTCKDPLHSTTHRDLDTALLVIRVMAERIEREQVHR